MPSLVVVLQEDPAGAATDLKIEFNPVLGCTISVGCDVQEERNIPAYVAQGWGHIPIVGAVGAIDQDLDP